MSEPTQADGKVFLRLFADLQEEKEFYSKKPLLAHYTSLATLEQILRCDEIWLSNPLFMNDYEEVRFGFNEGLDQVKSSVAIRDALKSESNYHVFMNEYDRLYDVFADGHVVDTYIFCLTEHDSGDNDGKLSMWRGYGASGNGACLVLDTAKVVPHENTPFIFARVHYATVEDRKSHIGKYIESMAEILSEIAPTDDLLRLGAYYLFERIKLFALFTKHIGFREEEEWRILYLPDRDYDKKVSPMIDYWIGPKGIEPKLKIKMGEFPWGEPGALSLSKIADRIIVGPTASTPLAIRMMKKMLSKIGRNELTMRVVPSTIPFRNS